MAVARHVSTVASLHWAAPGWLVKIYGGEKGVPPVAMMLPMLWRRLWSSYFGAGSLTGAGTSFGNICFQSASAWMRAK
jgi:hypothetical protein